VITAVDKKINSDTAMLARMVQIYCCHYHSDKLKGDIIRRGILETLDLRETRLCSGCAGLLGHGLVKLVNCPFDPKPRCKRCTEQCFSGEYRIFVKKVMRYSGLKLIKSGRIDLVWKYFF
jgi:hypothetical protein